MPFPRSFAPAGAALPAALALVLLAAATLPSEAHAYRLGKPTFAGAAVDASGASLVLRGTLGEAGLVGISQGGGYALALGFWPGTTATLVAADPQTPRAVELDLRAVPNPFNPATEFRFNLSRDGEVNVRLYDVTGRLVRTIDAGTLTAGSQALRWDGTDDSGSVVSSGQYFARLTQDGRALGPVLKVVLLK